VLKPDIDRYRSSHGSKGVSEEARPEFERQLDKWLGSVQALEQQVRARAGVFRKCVLCMCACVHA
jgi:hypothetical protein